MINPHTASLSLYDLLPGDAAGDTDPTAVAGDALPDEILYPLPIDMAGDSMILPPHPS